MLIDKGVNIFSKQTLLGIPGSGNNYQIIVQEVDGVEDVRLNVVAGPGVKGDMVEKALKEALCFSPRGMYFLSAACFARRCQNNNSRFFVDLPTVCGIKG